MNLVTVRRYLVTLITFALAGVSVFDDGDVIDVAKAGKVFSDIIFLQFKVFMNLSFEVQFLIFSAI